METYFKMSRSVREADVAAFASLNAENIRLKDEIAFLRKLLTEFSEGSSAISIQQTATRLGQSEQNKNSGPSALDPNSEST
jgi:hypothetical protein